MAETIGAAAMGALIAEKERTTPIDINKTFDLMTALDEFQLFECIVKDALNKYAWIFLGNESQAHLQRRLATHVNRHIKHYALRIPKLQRHRR